VRFDPRTAVALVLAFAAVPAAARGQQPAPANPHVRLHGKACTDCHTTTNWRQVRFDHGTTSFRLVGQHQTVLCAACHDLRDFAGATSTCSSCHTDPHRGDAGPRCERCHTEVGWRQVGAQNAHAGTRLPDLGVHSSLRCEDCHRQTGARQFTGRVAPCVACHQSTYDATTEPAHAAMGLPTQCEVCHQFTTWSFARFPQHDRIFPVYSGTHAGTWSGCVTCHTDRTTFRVYVCITCHTQPQTDPRHQGMPGYAWQSTSCLACHPAARRGDARFHEAIFPINSGTHNGKWTACTDCHTDRSNFAVFSCTTGACHAQPATDPGHAGVPGYQYASAQCLACHPDGRAGTFAQHDAVFPINSGTHQGKWTACADCHTDPSNRQVFSCTTGACHAAAPTNGLHQGIPNYLYTSAQCLSCHPTGLRGTFTQHDPLFFPVYGGTHAGKWTVCADCHADPNTRATFTCTGGACHAPATTNGLHQGIPSYAFTAAQCLACHPTGLRGTFTQHDPLFFPVYSGTHAGHWTVCADCHTDPNTRATFSCMTGVCHPQATTNAGHSAIPGYQYVAAQCRTCHPDGSAGTFAQHDAVFPINSGTHLSKWTACTDCHTDPTNRTVFSCMTGTCHTTGPTNALHQGIPSYGYTATQCYTCHPTGLRGTFSQHDPLFFPVYSGTHAGRWTACADCHTDPNTRATFSCTTGACHAATLTNALHQGIPSYAYAAAQCYACHPTGLRGTFTQHDALFFPIYSGRHNGQWSDNCLLCHTDPTTRATFTCMGGSCHPATTTNNNHSSVRNYAYVAASCYSCHPRGTSGVAPMIPVPRPPAAPHRPPALLSAGRRASRLEAAVRAYRMWWEAGRGSAGGRATSSG
jgi:hypothetical protein